MTNPNPFVPQGSLLSQQSKRQSRMKLAVFCVLAISVTGLMAMLIQGCKRTPPVDATADTNSTSVDTNASVLPADTNLVAQGSNNVPPAPVSTNPAPAAMPEPLPAPAPVPVPPVAEAQTSGAEYVVVKGDTFAKIAKKNGVSVRALEAANPAAQPTKLKVGQKLALPAGSKGSDVSAPSTGVSAGATDSGSTELYVVKSGDTLTKIAKAHGTTVRAIKAANNLTTNKISVGKKLKLPSKAEAPAPAATAPVEPAPLAPAPVTPPAVAPMTAPAPSH
jgi:LysM repeat protein